MNQKEQEIYDCLTSYLQEKTNVDKQFIAHQLLDLIKEEIAIDLQKVIGPCIDRIDKGSTGHLAKTREGVVSVEEISQIQKALRRYNFIERDYSTDEDPMGVLHSILAYLAPDFNMMRIKEKRYYDLKGLKNDEEVILNETQRGPLGVTIVDSEWKTEKETKEFTISLSSQSGQIDLTQALNQHLNDVLETDQSTVYLLKNEKENKYEKYSKVTHTKTIRTFTTASQSLFLAVKGSFDLNTLE